VFLLPFFFFLLLSLLLYQCCGRIITKRTNTGTPRTCKQRFCPLCTLIYREIYFYFFFLISEVEVRVSPLSTSATNWPTVPDQDDR
jgi:hypothetical protein